MTSYFGIIGSIFMLLFFIAVYFRLKVFILFYNISLFLIFYSIKLEKRNLFSFHFIFYQITKKSFFSPFFPLMKPNIVYFLFTTPFKVQTLAHAPYNKRMALKSVRLEIAGWKQTQNNTSH